ncbi:MAG TPA: histidine kinase [Anaerolineae bacterium]|nr:histidine kinase [Anaerolineae bacterium]
MSAGHLFPRFVRDSLRAKVTLGVVLPLVLILGSFTAIQYARQREAMLANLSFLASQTGQVIENSLQHAMLTQDLDELQHVLDAIGEGETIRVIYLLDTSGRIIFAPQGESVGAQLDNRDSNCQPCHRLPAAERPGSVVITLSDGQRVFRSMNPIENRPACQACHSPDQRLNGLLLTDIPMAPLEAPLAASLQENLLWWAGAILTTVIVVNLAMSTLVIRRLEEVAQALARFGRGQLGLRLPANNPDEIGQLAAAFNEMGQRIQSEEAENRALSEGLRREAAHRYELLKRLIAAQEDERRRVARDLHDGLGQDLAGLALRLEAIEQQAVNQPEQARAQLQQARVLIAETTEQAYAMILALRPSALDDLGLAPALRAHAERALKDTGVDFKLESRDLTRRLPPEIETALFRIFQEALTNVMRHAGARKVCVSLAARDGSFEGEIADDGRGFDLREVQANGHGPRGLGLRGMEERVAQCGGALDILSQPGAGTRIRIRIPLREADGV